MQKSILIIGMGQGLSLAVAEKFGKEGYQVGMISRSPDKLAGFQLHLDKMGIVSAYEKADLSDTGQMLEAIGNLKIKLPVFGILHYNAVDARMTPLMEETADTLTAGFRISVANVLEAVKAVMDDLTESQGSVLLTGGGSANYPNAGIASISLGKAAIQSLAYMLSESLKDKKIYVGTLTVSGWINPESKTHAPAVLAEKFWKMNKDRKVIEVTY
ncbi:SDR family NAD(P)-dependent oxidoreductase [Aquiflexum sp. TKW24L]|uniref:SDR family NAD(P)-dependent oxidoreductase n=1 Tax=Aquiflexum sp. TKW24L TaxID=2942212 RepID=UPI0020BF6099|nr:SDR family NAD(P)-dependent oxidoreductase [Aquiflexum sp. TKW24L]MCL6258843.1 SDR family NAD(P)-dependent oxidoreductase [Aquiflexum sp. TKW24L]